MKYGFSLYSLWGALRSGEMSVEDAFAWVAQNGADHMELVGFIMDMHKNGMPEHIAELSRRYHLPISAYSVGSILAQQEGEAFEQEIKRLEGEIDIGRRMGASLVRCDLMNVMMGKLSADIAEFDRLFPRMVRGAQALADYGAQFGMDITVENHGTVMNGSERVKRLLLAVNRPNYGLTLDIGNTVCVDEDPMVGVLELLPFAKRIHVKDFYIREDAYAIGAKYKEGYTIQDPRVLGNGAWLTTKHLRYLRGAILGHGDLPVRRILETIKESGYDGCLTIEFEGMEEPKLGCQISMQNLKQLTD